MIVSSEIVTDRAQNGGLRKIRQKFTDHLGEVHFRQFIVAANYDAAQGLIDGAAETVKELEKREEGVYRAELIEGRNPFRNADDSVREPEFHDRLELLSKVIHYFIHHEDPLILAKLVSFLALITDEQLRALLGVDQARVDSIRAKVVQVVAIQESYDAFEPEPGEGE